MIRFKGLSPSAWWPTPMTIVARSDFLAQQHQGTGRLRQKEQGQGVLPTPASARPAICAGTMLVEGWACASNDSVQGHGPGHERPVGQAGGPDATRPPNTAQQIESGKVKAYAVTSLEA